VGSRRVLGVGGWGGRGVRVSVAKTRDRVRDKSPNPSHAEKPSKLTIIDCSVLLWYVG